MDFFWGLFDNLVYVCCVVEVVVCVNFVLLLLVLSIKDVLLNINFLVLGFILLSQVFVFVREVMWVVYENEVKVVVVSGVSNMLLKLGFIIDLSRKKIVKLLEEIVDIIKDELEWQVWFVCLFIWECMVC